MAFDEVSPQTLQASSRSRHCCSLGASSVATFQLFGAERKLSAFLDEESPAALAKTQLAARRRRCRR